MAYDDQELRDIEEVDIEEAKRRDAELVDINEG